MTVTRSDKENLAQIYAGNLEGTAGFTLFNYHGLSVEAISELRNKVRETGGTIRVVRNRMMKRVIAEKPYAEDIKNLLLGPNCVIFAGDDPVTPAKALVDFAKTHEQLEIRGGVVGDDFLDASQIETLSKTPTLDQLHSMILGGVKAPASAVLGCVKGLHNKLHGLMTAYCDKLEEAA